MKKAERIYVSLCNEEKDATMKMTTSTELLTSSNSIGVCDRVERVGSGVFTAIDEMAMLTKMFESRSKVVKSSRNKFNTVMSSSKLGVSAILDGMATCTLQSEGSKMQSKATNDTGGIQPQQSSICSDAAAVDGGDAAAASTVGGVQLSSAFSCVHGQEPALTNWNGDFQG